MAVTCAEVEEIRDLYVLGALTGDAVEEIGLHLAECPQCREQVRSAWAVAQLIRLGVPEVEPSAALKDRIVQLAALDLATRPSPESPERPPEPGAAASRRSAVPFLTGSRWWSGSWARALAVGAPLAAALWLGTQVVVLRQQLDVTEGALRRSGQEARAVAELLGRGIETGSAMARIDGTDMAPAASGMLYYRPAATEGVFVVEGLPALPRDQVYQLWLVGDGTRMSGGTFVLEPGGKGMLLVKAPMPLGSLDWVGVSMEPSGGSASPRGASYMGGQIRRA